jgi:Mg/Co/Ni transporter MgtE
VKWTEPPRALLGYPEDSIGRLMTPDDVAVRADWAISRALEQIRATGRDSETINVIYVVDECGRLVTTSSCAGSSSPPPAPRSRMSWTTPS